MASLRGDGLQHCCATGVPPRSGGGIGELSLLIEVLLLRYGFFLFHGRTLANCSSVFALFLQLLNMCATSLCGLMGPG